MQHLKMLLVALATSMITFYVMPYKDGMTNHISAKETTYERVMRTGTIRCGWLTRPPYLMVNMNTGQKSGIVFDIMTELAKQLSLKIDWVEEVGTAEFVPALNSQRYDAICVGGWMNAQRARQIDITMPLAFDTGLVWARTGDNRFDQLTKADLNAPEKIFATLDGATPTYMTHLNFPKATYHSLPESAPLIQVATEVSMKKADLVVMAEVNANLYNQANPQQQIKSLKNIGALGRFPVVIFIDKDQQTFKRMLDNTIADLHALGFIEATIKKYNGPQNGILFIDQGYQTP